MTRARRTIVHRTIRKLKFFRGFTLIELLVVIAILAVLTAITLPAFQSVRSSGRDDRRQSDVSNIKLALIQYRAANSGQFPSISPNPSCITTSGRCWGGYAGTDASIVTKLAPFMGNIPSDPLPSRGIGDKYIFFSGTTPHSCTSVPSAMVTGNFVIWYPDKGSPSVDADCLGQGFVSCCYAMDCAVGNFCAAQLDE